MTGIKKYSFFIAGVLVCSTATEAVALETEYKVGITEGWSSIEVMHNGERIEVKRIQDTNNRLLDDFSKTSRPCPPFCIHLISASPGVTTVGEVELIQFVKEAVESGTGLLIDARMQNWYRAETIPGSINIPFIVFTSRRETLKKLLLELGVTEKQGKLNYDNALSLLLYCNGPWCDQSPRAIKALLELGYPPEKLYYYRGGMQLWKLFGLTTVIPRLE